MTQTSAITLTGVSKRYRRPQGAPRSTTLKGLVVHDLWRALWHRARSVAQVLTKADAAAGARTIAQADATAVAETVAQADVAAGAGIIAQADAAAGAETVVQADGAAAARASATLPTSPNADGAIWALKDISLEFPRGQVTGIIGANGAGKSTLLKLLGLIVRPDLGTLVVRGRIAALIELGAGFHPELTGRENVLINGVILGLSRAEVRARMQEIIDFAQVGEFIDFPVRTYSSGMYARLGFAVAIHVDPDILLVDEVLSVGDAAFTAKCRGALDDFRRRGKSIVVVSHDLSTIASFCDTAIWLDKGRVRQQGPARDIVQAYEHS